MGKKEYKNMLAQEEPILWSDRKRILGLPLSFTKYSLDKDRLYLQKGFFRTEMNELLLYRVLDLKSARTLGQKLFGVGTVTLMSSDQSSPMLELKNIRDCERVRRFLSELVEQQRSDLGIRGREIYGSAVRAGMDPDNAPDSGPDMGMQPPPPPPVDLDGDGMPG